MESLARLNHPNLCKLIGFTREDPSRSTLHNGIGLQAQRERLLVFDYAANGSLDTLLYCREGKAPLDWVTRLKIASGAAEGLAFLHDRMPRQVSMISTPLMPNVFVARYFSFLIALENFVNIT
mgnify:FL=1